MTVLHAGCHCGNIRAEAGLTRAPQAYHPRACDCDFCLKHAAAYVSDPQGSLAIRIKDAAQVSRYRQGSGSADCLVCRHCGVLVAVTYQSDGRLYATLNARAATGTAFGAEKPVSPQTLEAGDKVRRWQELWFADVTLLS